MVWYLCLEIISIEKIWFKSIDHSSFIKHGGCYWICISLVGFKKSQARFLHFLTICHRNMILIWSVGLRLIKHLRSITEFLSYLRIWLYESMLIHCYRWISIWWEEHWRTTIVIYHLLALFLQSIYHWIIHVLMMSVHSAIIPIGIALIHEWLLHDCHLILVTSFYSWGEFT